MADVRSPRMTMAEENSVAKRLPDDEDRGSPHRGWKCPSDEMIASYLDAALDSPSRSRLESHLADCEYCRALVAELAKVQRDLEMPSLPPGLMQRAVALVAPKSTRMHWLWAPAAMAGAAFLVIVAVLLRSPEQPIIPSPSAPAAPVIAKSEPAPTLGPPAHEVVRKPYSADLLPSIVSPHPGSIVARERLEFQWETVPHSRYYEIRVVTAEGDLVWEGQSEGSVLQPPADVTLNDGSYFVWITAYLENGREAKSAPVSFSLASPR
jgi:Putative zinc-finger